MRWCNYECHFVSFTYMFLCTYLHWFHTAWYIVYLFMGVEMIFLDAEVICVYCIEKKKEFIPLFLFHFCRLEESLNYCGAVCPYK